MSKKIKEIIYLAGVVTDNSELLKEVKDGYPNVFCHHMTIQYGGIKELPDFIGDEFVFVSNRICKDKKAIAITGIPEHHEIQTVMNENDQHCHITICTAADVKPVYSNTLIQVKKGQKINITVPMKVGAFCSFDDGTTEWVFEK